ncbi:hypothetical protein ILYODFUR_024904 [Ilyodon furcidens]|uniref:Uncharacterized protein n=1 Tax=Ilyodon furcidens TaxID=33524 RepID=A0ABV0TND4_9TELE
MEPKVEVHFNHIQPPASLWHHFGCHSPKSYLQAGLKFSGDHMNKQNVFWRKDKTTKFKHFGLKVKEHVWRSGMILNLTTLYRLPSRVVVV